MLFKINKATNEFLIESSKEKKIAMKHSVKAGNGWSARKIKTVYRYPEIVDCEKCRKDMFSFCGNHYDVEFIQKAIARGNIYYDDKK